MVASLTEIALKAGDFFLFERTEKLK